MAIEKKALKDVSSELRGSYQTAMTAKDMDYGIMILKGIVQKEPGFIEARDQLRKLEKQKTGQPSFIGKLMISFKTSATVTHGKTLLATNKPLDAMRKAEDALFVSLASISALNLLAQAGQALGARFITIEALEIAREYFPQNIVVLDWLASEYSDDKQGKKALRIRQEIVNLKPEDLDAQQKVRAAAALATMDENKWEDKSTDFRAKLKDKGEAVQLEQQDRIARNIDDVTLLIDSMEKQVAEGKAGIDVKRKLAELYQKADHHEKAIVYLEMVVKEMGAMDPFIDRAIEKSKLALMDKSIAEWQQFAQANPGRQAEADTNVQAFEGQRFALRLERALDRVNNYPNDLQLRYELAVIYFEGNDIDNAMHQFQLAQRNPQRRLSSIVYLGQCFHKGGQLDIAMEELTKAISEMPTMDRPKMDALYSLALVYEDSGNKEKAAECYKQVYRANIKYRDVADRMAKLAVKV